MIAFIDEHRAIYGVEPICMVLPIAPPTYFAHAAWRADPGRLPARARRDAALEVEIRCVWEANLRVYRVRRSGASLAGRGSQWPVAPLPA
jgi:putative transposase